MSLISSVPGQLKKPTRRRALRGGVSEPGGRAPVRSGVPRPPSAPQPSIPYGAYSGMDVQRRPNFSIVQEGFDYILVAREVTAGVRKQVAAFLRRLRGKVLVNGTRMSKRTALRKIPGLLRKGSVHVSLE